jgi:tetratricopeptide (TPR) repeat protein
MHQGGELRRAAAGYEQVLKLDPRHVGALHLLGVVCAQQKNPARAAELIGKALSLDPRNAALHFHLASALKELGRLQAALARYDSAVALRPDHAEAHCYRGMVLRDLGQWDEAVASCERALALRPQYAEAAVALGKVYRQQRRWEEALAGYERALAINPALAEAHCERGIALRELDRRDEALESYERALALDANYVNAHVNRGNVQKDLGRFDAALASFDAALRLQPEFATAHCNRSTILLLRGAFADGWRDYEWRWQDHNSTVIRQARNFSQPRWRGEPLPGKTLLLHAEQGLGDTLQFSRYATLAAELGATVILQIQKPLVGLLSSVAGVSAVYAEPETPEAFDYYCPLMSLPLAFGTSLETIPAKVPYLEPPAATRAAWALRLGERRRPRVGLVWSGGFRPTQPEVWAAHARRNVPLAQFAALANPNIEFYSLQKGQPAEAELAALEAQGWGGPKLIDLTGLLEDFSDTAALIEQLDLVISVDTSTAHLAGALGKPVWILNRFDTCWRWLEERRDSPWYPSARLYRQAVAGDWTGVLERVKADLEAEFRP